VSTPKTQVDEARVADFLRERYGDVRELVSIKGGEISQAFSFVAEGRKLVLRVNWYDGNFRKDRFAHEHFSSAAVPIPEVLDLGVFGEGLFFAVTPFARGSCMPDLCTSAVLTALEAIHATDVSAFRGYGRWVEGEGAFASWAEAVETEAHVDPATLRLPFVRKPLFDRLARGLAENLPAVSEERRLVHGDFGFDNLFVDGEQVTAVTDWDVSRFGDPVYDVAWVTAWTLDRTFARLYRERAEQAGRDLPDFERRLVCHECSVAILGLSFFAQTGREETYREFAAGTERYLDALQDERRG
jgi:hygromycin-B 4-O-kinase